MSWLHPWLLWGCVAALLPLLLHWLGKRKAPAVVFAAFDFLWAAHTRMPFWERLKRWLLLCARIAFVCGLAMALARPVPSLELFKASKKATRMVVVLDVSLSMSYVLRGETFLEKAHKRTLQLLKTLAPGDSANVVVAGASPYVLFPQLTQDLHGLQQAVKKTVSENSAAHMSEALRLAFAQLAVQGSEGGRVYVVSDVSANSFEGIAAVGGVPAGVLLEAVDVTEQTPRTALSNVAVHSVAMKASAGSLLEKQFHVTLQHFGVAAVASCRVQLHVDGKTASEAYYNLPPHTNTQAVFTYAFAKPGYYAVSVALKDCDGFAWDDVFHVWAHVAAPVRVLALNGESKTIPQEDEVFFVDKALQALGDTGIPVVLKTVSADAFEPAMLSREETDVVWLAHVSLLPAELPQALASFLNKGGGVLWSMGKYISFEDYNRTVGSFLPHPLRDMRCEEGASGESVFVQISELDDQHPVFAQMPSEAYEGVKSSKTRCYFNLDKGADARITTLARFEHGAPALVEAQLPFSGTVMMFTSSLDRDLTDLPLRSVFPLLMQRIFGYLGRASVVEQSFVRTGESAPVSWPVGAEKYVFVSPSGRKEAGEVNLRAQLAPSNLWKAPWETGVYRMQVFKNTWNEDQRFFKVVNPSLIESDFSPIEGKALAEQLSYGKEDIISKEAVEKNEGINHKRGYAGYVLMAIALLFVLEGFLASHV